MSPNVIRPAITVFIFWWVILAVYGLAFGDPDWIYLFRSTVSLLVLGSIGVVAGIVLVWVYIWQTKKTTKLMLGSENVRGLSCTIGELPIVTHEPRRSNQLPDFKYIKDLPADFYPNWFKQYEATHPAHVAFMRALLQVYERHKHLPATHIEGGHGGRSLLDHSLLVGYFIDKLSKDWSYSGLKSKGGTKVLLRLRDPSYKFNPVDPLVSIIGVAHDIGKIETYIYDKRDPSRIVGIHHEHDLTGARMIARLPEAWAIPDEDRRAIFLSIAHYHHPMELPLSPDNRAIDDRTIALMELLIKADFVTSAVESRGVVPSDQEYDEADKEPTPNDAEAIYSAFVDLISESGRINSPDPRFNVGSLCTGTGFEKPMLFIKEDAVRGALYAKLRMPIEPSLGDGRYPLTIKLLNVLDSKNMLVKEHRGKKFSPENALWNVDFMTRPAGNAVPTKKTGWAAVLVVDPTSMPKIAEIEPYWWNAHITRPTMGGARAVDKKGPRVRQPIQAMASADDDDDDFDDDRSLGHTSLPAPVKSPSPSASGVPEQRKEEGVSPPPAATAPQAPLSTDVAITTPVERLIAALQEGRLAPTLTPTHAVFTLTEMQQIVPDIDWVKDGQSIASKSTASGRETRYLAQESGDSVQVFLAVALAAAPPAQEVQEAHVEPEQTAAPELVQASATPTDQDQQGAEQASQAVPGTQETPHDPAPLHKLANALRAGEQPTMSTETHNVFNLQALQRLSPDIDWTVDGELVANRAKQDGLDVRFLHQPENSDVFLAIPKDWTGAEEPALPSIAVPAPQLIVDLWEDGPLDYGVATRTDPSARELRDVLKGIVDRVESGVLQTPAEDDYLITSATLLQQISPEIDWPQCQYQIKRLATRLEELELEIIPTDKEGAGGYLVRFRRDAAAQG